MNAEVQFIVSIASSVAYASYSGYKLCQTHKKHKLFGVLMSNTAGLGEILDEIEIDKSRIYPLVIDTDWLKEHSSVEQYEALERHKSKDGLFYDMLVYRLVKDYLKEMKKANPRLVFVVITSSHKLLHDLKVKTGCLSLLLPSSKYHMKILSRLESEEEKEMDGMNREKYLNLNLPRFEYSNKASLVDVFERMFLKKQEVRGVAI